MTRVRCTGVVLALVVVLARPACADPFLDEVVSVTVGEGGGAGAGTPANVFGPPRGLGAFQGSMDTISLGISGSIVVAFRDNVVVDGPGPDLTVFENPFLKLGLTTLEPYAEPGTVSVSADGETWATFPCAIDEPPYHPGCAGVYPVFANAGDPLAPSALAPSTTPIDALVGVPVDDFVAPAGSGGDTFDLAAVGLAAVRFVRIDGGPLDLRASGLSGFDLDAAAALHSVETTGTADRDADGIVDAADDCPALADPAQRDGDGDGSGDACDVCPDVAAATVDGCPGSDPVDPGSDPGSGSDPGAGGGGGTGGGGGAGDADADGTPDGADPCPADARCDRFVEGAFTGGRGGRAAERLLTYAQPGRGRVDGPAAGPLRFVVAIAPEVTPDSVRVRVGGHDRTADLGPFAPGSTRTVDVEPAGRKTVVVFQASARRGTRRQVDRDRFVIVRK